MITNNKGATGPAVAFRDVVKVYHPNMKALDHVSFDIQPGETVALLGPNGAGKSTAIDTMLGLRAPTSGEVRILGGPAAAAVAAGQIGGMLQTGGLPEGARVSELIGLFRQLYRDRRSTTELLTLAGNPELLFLDEPTAALDVEARRHFWRSVETIAGQGATVLFATHYLEEADANATRIIVVNHGRVIADGTPAQIKAFTATRTLRFSTAAPDPSELLKLPGVTDVVVNGDAVTVHTGDADGTLPALYALG